MQYTTHNPSKDAQAVQDMVKRTGQSGVPVTLIDSKAVVGFDTKKLNALLGLKQ